MKNNSAADRGDVPRDLDQRATRRGLNAYIATSAACLGALALASFSNAAPAAAPPTAGKTVFARCAACHSVDSARNMSGPSLQGVVNRAPGSAPGFNYSPALKKLGGKWTPERLDAFLASPQKYAPGTRMAFSGLRKPEVRAAVIALLKSSRKK